MTEPTPPPDPHHAPDGGPRNPPPAGRDAELIALSGALRRLREQHSALASSVSEQLAPDLEALRAALVEQIGGLRHDLNALATEIERAQNPPVDWFHLDADQARQEWTNLARWLAEDFVPWYQITRDQLPDCWALHRPALLELSWLRSAHIQAYLPHAHPHITAEWHTRWKDAALANIRAAIPPALCRPGEHLVTEEDSRRNRTPAPPPGRPPAPSTPPSPGRDTVQTARRQLATPEHWQDFYQQAAAADIAWREQRARTPSD